jgi:transcriptional regulator with XRE-family HTH domain
MKTLSMIMEAGSLYDSGTGDGTTPAPSERPNRSNIWKVIASNQEPEPIALDSNWNDFHEGSGSVYPISCLVQHLSTGPYGKWVRIVPSTGIVSDWIASPSKMLAIIKSELSLSITELAKIMEVERPTLYSWLSDKTTPHPTNRERMTSLYMVALEWKKLSTQSVGSLRHHVFNSGFSLVDLLKVSPISLENILSCLSDLAKLSAEKVKSRKLTGKELAKKFGIKIKSKPEEWDFLSGKRIGLE